MWLINTSFCYHTRTPSSKSGMLKSFTNMSCTLELLGSFYSSWEIRYIYVKSSQKIWKKYMQRYVYYAISQIRRAVIGAKHLWKVPWEQQYSWISQSVWVEDYSFNEYLWIIFNVLDTVYKFDSLDIRISLTLLMRIWRENGHELSVSNVQGKNLVDPSEPMFIWRGLEKNLLELLWEIIVRAVRWSVHEDI